MASLGNDLATIRKQQNLRLEDIHNTTKIPPHILRAIEDETIFTDFEENKTYIRSYIRSYCKALHLDDELVVRALNEYEEGTYNGLLLGGEAEEQETGAPGTAGPEPADTQGDAKPEPGTEQPVTGEGSDQPGGDADTDMVHDHAPGSDEERDESRVIEQKQIPKPPSVGTVDWADMGRKFSPLQPKSRMWIGVVAVLLIVIAVIFFWFYQSGYSLLNNNLLDDQPGTTQALSQPAVVPDSLQLNLADSEAEEPVMASAPRALGDTLHILIYAAYGKLEPVRVYTDVMDDLNPYWIEEGEAVRFEFVNLIRFRGQYSRMELLMNGHPVPNFRQQFYDPDTSMVVIERSYFENDERWLQPPPDSTELNFVPPTLVTDRPIFN